MKIESLLNQYYMLNNNNQQRIEMIKRLVGADVESELSKKMEQDRVDVLRMIDDLMGRNEGLQGNEEGVNESQEVPILLCIVL